MHAQKLVEASPSPSLSPFLLLSLSLSLLNGDFICVCHFWDYTNFRLCHLFDHFECAKVNTCVRTAYITQTDTYAHTDIAFPLYNRSHFSCQKAQN